MNPPNPPEGLEPVAELDLSALPRPIRPEAPGVVLPIRGRRVRLRGLRRAPTGLLRWALILGPGIIAASAGNDAGGITTYSAAGARFGYDLIWVMVLLTVGLGAVQEMCARLGAATGRGLLDLIRERFGLGWALVAVGAVLVANAGLVVSEFIGIGAAAELLGVNKYVVILLAAVVLWYLVIYGSYASVEKVFLGMTLVFLAYPVAAVLARPDWGAVARGALVPTVQPTPAYLFMLVGLLGTTITPYMQVFQQSSMVERAVARRHYGPERLDAYAGATFSNLMSIAMIIATAATLHVAGPAQLESAADAARALEPVAGPAAEALFAVGLLGASLLAVAVLPVATAYAVSDAFGVPKGINLDFRRAPVFFGLFTAMLVLGAAVAMLPGVPVVRWLLVVQVLNGVLMPVVLFFVLRLVNDEHLAGPLKNTRAQNWVIWTTLVAVTVSVLAMFALQAAQAAGLLAR